MPTYAIAQVDLNDNVVDCVENELDLVRLMLTIEVISTIKPDSATAHVNSRQLRM